MAADAGQLASWTGEATLAGREWRAIDVAALLESVSGDLEMELELAEDDIEVEAETLSGEVRLTVPRLPDVEIDLETYSGQIERSELLPDARGKEYSRDGKGKGRVSLQSFSGDIEVRKKP